MALKQNKNPLKNIKKDPNPEVQENMEIICFVHEIGPPCINLRVSIFVIRTLTESTHINTCWANFIHKTYDFHIFLDDWEIMPQGNFCQI
jgi:hypothetical protein